jgi:hypothetical protein
MIEAWTRAGKSRDGGMWTDLAISKSTNRKKLNK